MTTLEDWRTHAERVVDTYKRCMLAETPEEYDKVRHEISKLAPPPVPTVPYIEFSDAVTIIYLQYLVTALRDATRAALDTLRESEEEEDDS